MESFIKRKEYLASILNVLGNAVLEYDTDGYRMITLLFDHQGFCFIAQGKSINNYQLASNNQYFL